MSADEQRKLAAIMFTDMVGYSALSQRDEKLAQELLEEHRRLLREIFPRFNGTEIKTIGDAFLVEFGSALEAAQCAIEIQRTLAKRDADATADRQIQVRIGVHIGDVVHRGGDVYGDGVNIASRIEPVAGPGGICVSMDVERQVRNALEARFEKLAPTDLKNTSVMQYKSGAPRNLREIGQQLGVAHVVEGSVQRAANKVRVNAQLIDARNDGHLWAQTYDRDLADVFAIQSEIAKSIADQLQAKLSPAEKSAIEQRPTTDVAAFELYSRAKDLILNVGFSAIAAQNLRSGIELLNQALARDPSFFAAQCQLAFAHDTLYALGLDHTPQRLALAEAAVEAAFRLRPDAGQAHLARTQP